MEDRYLLISDLDGTLLGNDQSLQQFARWHQPLRDRLLLVYSSGRLVDSVNESVATTDLPKPDAVIGGVGTQIQSLRAEFPIENWPRSADRWQSALITSILSEYDELELQPAEFLAEYKISYFAHDTTKSLIEEIRGRLSAAGCDVELVYSSQRDLDVLPRGVNKGTAAAHLAEQWNFDKDHVVVSGDTANDLAMFQHGFLGIVVSNAHPELRSLDTPRIFQSTHPHAAGVQEGLMHWMSLPVLELTSATDMRLSK